MSRKFNATTYPTIGSCVHVDVIETEYYSIADEVRTYLVFSEQNNDYYDKELYFNEDEMLDLYNRLKEYYEVHEDERKD